MYTTTPGQTRFRERGKSRRCIRLFIFILTKKIDKTTYNKHNNLNYELRKLEIGTGFSHIGDKLIDLLIVP